MMATVSTFKSPGEIVFGAGALSTLPEKVREQGASKVFLVTDKGLRATGRPDAVAEALHAAGLTVTLFDAISGEPSFEMLETGREALATAGADLVIGLGGGSAMDVAKASASLAGLAESARQFVGTNLIPRPGLPNIAIPTTAGTASEITPNAIFADLSDGVKKGIVSRYMIPRVALIDPELTYSVPPAVTAATGMDALVHAVESYVSPKATLLTRMHARQSIELIAGALRTAVHTGSDQSAREAMAWGSLLAGLSFANAGVGGVHALAYPLGGKFHVAHGVSNALLLAPVMRFSAETRPALFAEMAPFFGVSGATEAERSAAVVQAMASLSLDVAIPQRLRDVGVPEDALEAMSVEASKIERLLVNNARPMNLDDIRAIYRAAW